MKHTWVFQLQLKVTLNQVELAAGELLFLCKGFPLLCVMLKAKNVSSKSIFYSLLTVFPPHFIFGLVLK